MLPAATGDDDAPALTNGTSSPMPPALAPRRRTQNALGIGCRPYLRGSESPTDAAIEMTQGVLDVAALPVERPRTGVNGIFRRLLDGMRSAMPRRIGSSRELLP